MRFFSLSHLPTRNRRGHLYNVMPYSASSFNPTQHYQCSCDDGASWTNIHGPTTITRAVFKNAQSKWAAVVAHSDTATTSTYVIPCQ